MRVPGLTSVEIGVRGLIMRELMQQLNSGQVKSKYLGRAIQVINITFRYLTVFLILDQRNHQC